MSRKDPDPRLEHVVRDALIASRRLSRGLLKEAAGRDAAYWSKAYQLRVALFETTLQALIDQGAAPARLREWLDGEADTDASLIIDIDAISDSEAQLRASLMTYLCGADIDDDLKGFLTERLVELSRFAGWLDHQSGAAAAAAATDPAPYQHAEGKGFAVAGGLN